MHAGTSRHASLPCSPSSHPWCLCQLPPAAAYAPTSWQLPYARSHHSLDFAANVLGCPSDPAGSNMNKKVLSGRRMIKPAASLPAVLPGWQLTFSQLGLPYTEPGFAAVERQPAAATAEAANGGGAGGGAPPPSARQRRPDVHGVLHRITPSQWAYVLETEGASKEDSEDGGYAVVTTTAVTYDGKQVEGVKTLTVPARIKQRLQVSRASRGGRQRAWDLGPPQT